MLRSFSRCRTKSNLRSGYLRSSSHSLKSFDFPDASVRAKRLSSASLPLHSRERLIKSRVFLIRLSLKAKGLGGASYA